MAKKARVTDVSLLLELSTVQVSRLLKSLT